MKRKAKKNSWKTIKINLIYKFSWYEYKCKHTTNGTQSNMMSSRCRWRKKRIMCTHSNNKYALVAFFSSCFFPALWLIWIGKNETQQKIKQREENNVGEEWKNRNQIMSVFAQVQAIELQIKKTYNTIFTRAIFFPLKRRKMGKNKKQAEWLIWNETTFKLMESCSACANG